MLSLEEMIENGTMTDELAKKIIEAAQKKESILIFGQKYAGKTTLAKCIAEISNGIICDDIFHPEEAVKFLDLTNNCQPAIGIIGACSLKKAKKNLFLLTYLGRKTTSNINNIIKHFIFLFRAPSGKIRIVYFYKDYKEVFK